VAARRTCTSPRNRRACRRDIRSCEELAVRAERTRWSFRRMRSGPCRIASTFCSFASAIAFWCFDCSTACPDLYACGRTSDLPTKDAPLGASARIVWATGRQIVPDAPTRPTLMTPAAREERGASRGGSSSRAWRTSRRAEREGVVSCGARKPRSGVNRRCANGACVGGRDYGT